MIFKVKQSTLLSSIVSNINRDDLCDIRADLTFSVRRWVVSTLYRSTGLKHISSADICTPQAERNHYLQGTTDTVSLYTNHCAKVTAQAQQLRS